MAHRKRRFGAFAGIVAAITLVQTAPTASAQAVAGSRPSAAARIAYGSEPSQFGDLWLPPGQPAPVPVVVMIHGGCWQFFYGLDLMNGLAEDLYRQGIAVWNIEYRRLGESGGGYPGTFLDVAKAVDKLRDLPQRSQLDLPKLGALGHSAGGQLALWAAARPKLPADSAVAGRNPQRVAAAVTLAGIDDLAAYRSAGPACGGASTIDTLIGADSRGSSTAMADTSPAALLPIGVPQLIVSGSADSIVPAKLGENYAVRARTAGDRVESVVIDGADHFALIDPGSAAWAKVRKKLLEMLR